MRFQAAVSLAFAGTVIAAGAADNVIAVLKQINTDLQAFNTAINAYAGGSDTAQLTAASDKIESDTKSGASTIKSGAALTDTDAVSITTAVTGLQGTLDKALADLKGIGDKLAAAGQCGTIQGQLKSQYATAGQLADAIAEKTPEDLKGVGKTLSGQISTSIQNTQEAFGKICANAPSGSAAGGPGGSGGATHGPPSSGGNGGSGAPGGKSGGGSSTSAPPPAGGSATHGKDKPATSKPATFTGAASSFTVPALLCAVALAVATL